MKRLVKCFLGIAMLITSVSALAATPYYLSYSGRLVETSGKPLEGTVDLDVAFFLSETGNDEITAVTIPHFNSVPLSEGVFQIALSLTTAEFHAIFNGTDAVWIQITDIARNKTYPRQRFSAVPYALKVPADGQSITYNSDGKLALGNSAYTLKLPAAAGGLDKVLKSDGAGGLVWADDLTGGVGSITSTDIQDGSVASVDIEDGTIENVDVASGAAIATSKLAGAVTSITGHGLGSLATKSSVGSADITDGEIVNGDISDTAAIATLKLSGAVTSISGHGLGALATKGAVTSADITDGEIVNGDISDTAAIATSKLSGAVTSISGHGLGALATKGAITSADITDGEIVNDDVAANAAIAGTKISPNFGTQNIVTTGTVTADSFSGDGSALTKLPFTKGYLEGLVVSWNSLSRINISAGRGEMNDKYFEKGSITQLDLSDFSAGMKYIYIDYSASTLPYGVEFIVSTTEPSYHSTKNGWYNGDDRAIGAVYTNGTNMPAFGAVENRVYFGVSNPITLHSGGATNGASIATSVDENTVTPIFAKALYVYCSTRDTTSATLLTYLTVYPVINADLKMQRMGHRYLGFEAWIPVNSNRNLMYIGEDNDDDAASITLWGYEISR